MLKVTGEGISKRPKKGTGFPSDVAKLNPDNAVVRMTAYSRRCWAPYTLYLSEAINSLRVGTPLLSLTPMRNMDIDAIRNPIPL